MGVHRLTPSAATAVCVMACLMLAGCVKPDGQAAPSLMPGSVLRPSAVAPGREAASPGGALDPAVASVIRNAREIVMRTVVPRPGTRASDLGDFLVVGQARPLSGGRADRLRGVLLARESYLSAGIAPSCPARPEIIVEFSAGDETVTMAASASCGAVSFFRNRDWRPTRMLWLNENAADLHGLFKSALNLHAAGVSSA